MLELGALPADVDGPMRAFGMPMGPLQMSDLAGNDIGYNVRKDFGWTFPASALADKLVESGRLGQKTGGGWYDYDAKRKPNPSAAVETMIVEHSAAAGATRRPMGADEVLDRCLLPLVNEVRADRSPPSPHRARRLPQPDAPPLYPPQGFKILEEGIAQRESDIDVVYLYGYGFPRWRGGPMHWARHGRDGGLPKLVADLRRYADAYPQVAHWKPSELLVREAGAASKL